MNIKQRAEKNTCGGRVNQSTDQMRKACLKDYMIPFLVLSCKFLEVLSPALI